MEQEVVSGVPARATQGTKARRREWWWAEASIWTERMVSALVNGVKACPQAGRRPDPWGGKWFSLVDKVIRPTTLERAWRQVARNNGAAGGDGQSIERFAATQLPSISEPATGLSFRGAGSAREPGNQEHRPMNTITCRCSQVPGLALLAIPE